MGQALRQGKIARGAAAASALDRDPMPRPTTPPFDLAAFPSDARGCVVAFGDSITRGFGVTEGEGWVELLSEQLKGGPGKSAIPVFNAGGNGNTSAEGLKRIEADVLVHMPGRVLVEFGGNDAVHDARAVSVDEFEDNLLAILQQVRRRGGEVALLTFPPIINEWHATRSDAYYARWGGLDQCVEEYRQRTRAMATLHSVPLLDLDRLLRTQIACKGKAALIMADGVHLTSEAHRWVSRAILEVLENQDGRLR